MPENPYEPPKGMGEDRRPRWKPSLLQHLAIWAIAPVIVVAVIMVRVVFRSLMHWLGWL